MKDIIETLRARKAGIINLSAGNPLILPEVELWRDCTQNSWLAYGEVVCRYGSSQG